MTTWSFPSADKVGVLRAVVVATCVAAGAVPIALDFLHLSPLVASIVTYGDLFRAMPTTVSLLGLSCWITFTTTSMLPRGRSIAGTITFVGAAACFGSSGISSLQWSARPMWMTQLQPLLVFATWTSFYVMCATILARHEKSAVWRVGSGIVGIFVLTALFWRPLDGPVDTSDTLCTDECVATDILRVYEKWIIHRRSPGRLEFQKLEDVTSFRIGRAMDL